MDENAIQALYVLGIAAPAKGDFDTAITALEQSATKFADPFSLAYLGMTHELAGKRDQARAVLNRLESTCGSQAVAAIFPAFILTGLGDNSAAIDHIEMAFEEHHAFVLWLGVSPEWDVLRCEPRFQNLLLCLDLAACLGKQAACTAGETRVARE